MTEVLRFGPFRLDLATARVWRGAQALKLTAKALAVLRYLAAHPGQVVTKAELFAAVWPQTVVSDAALTVCIRELRQALGDNAQAPQYIETVHRQGYRFVAPLHDSPAVATPPLPVREGAAHAPSPELVGRAAELRQLQRWLEKAVAGQRQLGFVTGEAGIGKTAVVDAFCAQLAAAGGYWFGRGHCIEHFGAGEAYLPVLTALEPLCQPPAHEHVRPVLRQHAPTWLLQLPAMLSAADREELRHQTAGATQERMLREMAGALERLTALQPLVLVLEDLHWSDSATLDLLAYLARRPQPARLLVIGTYRPVELIVRDHPLRAVHHELQLHGWCAELPLGFLGAEDVRTYLALRFPDHRLPAVLGEVLYERTEGNPLFLTALINEWVMQGVIVSDAGTWVLRRAVPEIAGQIPHSVRQLVGRQLERLSPEERSVAEAASVAGVEFSAAAVAAGVGGELVAVEAQCEVLARRHLLFRPHGAAVWPDGTVATRYGFLHALYQEVLYAQVAAGRRSQLHQRIGKREEVAYGTRASEIAAELAMHFEQGGEYPYAIQYLQHAAKRALRRSAPHEAIRLLTRALEMLTTLPDTPERVQLELTLRLSLGPPLMAAKGYAAREVERTYTRARALCHQLGETADLFSILRGLWVSALLRAELRLAHELGEQLLTFAQRVQDPTLLVEADYALGATCFFQGEVVSARPYLEHGIALYERSHHSAHTSLYGQDPGVFCRLVLALTLWVLGYPDQGRARMQEALPLAQELGDPNTYAGALSFAAWLHHFRRERRATQAQAEAVQALCQEHGFPFWLAWGTILRGWAVDAPGAGDEGMTQIHQGLAALHTTGAELVRPYILVLLAEAQGNRGQAEKGQPFLTEGLAVMDNSGEHWCEAELYRLIGTLTLQSNASPRQGAGRSKTGQQYTAGLLAPSPTPGTQAEAEACFHKAIETAQHQQAKSLELRAVMSLSRLWQQQGKKAEARRKLAEIYGWFTEGFATKDLQEANALLTALS
jgi:DNA-binding winged helix-turn-helix (wHTH) protein/predicted ATPase